jgi:hypothetical protein
MSGEIEARTRKRHRLAWALLTALLCGTSAVAQVTVGDYLKMNLAGSMGFGYSGGFGSQGSSHGQSFAGDGNLTGSYYNPNFINFNFHPFYDRSQSSATSGILTHDTGFDTSVGLFGGSRFPGSVYFGKTFSNSSEFGLPGVVGLATHGSGQSFGISWSELLPGLPPLYASFGTSSNTYSALGTNEENHNSSTNFNLHSNYRLAGFDLAGSFGHQNQSYTSPSFLGLATSGSSSTTNYGVSVQHRLPLRGTFGAGWDHSSYDAESNGSKGSSSNMSAGVGFQPFNRLNISANTNYTTNLNFALMQNVTGAAGVPIAWRNFDSHALRIGSSASLSLPYGFTINAQASQNTATFLGKEYSTTQYGATVTYRYSRPLLGMLYFSFGLIDHATQEGNSGLSLVSSVGLSRRFGRWETSADFGYSQDVQTLYALGTTSSYSYGGSLRRKVNSEMYWSTSFRAAHSGLVQRAGSSSGSESINTSFTWRRLGFGVGYGQSRGTSVFTSSGLVTPTPLLPLITNDFVFFNGRSLSISANTRVLRRLVLTSSFSKAHSDTESKLLNTFTASRIYNVKAEYKVRKLSLTSGFERIEQEISTSAAGPVVVNSYYFRLSRWFQFF